MQEDKIKGVYSYKSMIIYKVKKVFKGIWNSIVIIAESAVNAIIKGLNWLISKINTIKFTVPSWVPGLGGKSIGGHLSSLSEVHLPRLATKNFSPCWATRRAGRTSKRRLQRWSKHLSRLWRNLAAVQLRSLSSLTVRKSHAAP